MFFVIANGFSVIYLNDNIGLFDFLIWDQSHEYSVFIRPVFPFSQSLFASAILFSAEKRLSAGHKIIILMNCILAFLVLLAIFPSYTALVRELWDPIFILYAIILAGITLKEAIDGTIGAWPYFFAQFVFLASIFILLSSLGGFLAYSSFIPIYVLLGLVAEVSLMSMTLANRVVHIRESKLENDIKIKLQHENEENLKYLLRVIHHDINNALHIILNASYIAKKRNPENKMIEKVIYASNIIKDLIQSVRNYELTLEGKEDIYIGPVSMVGLFDKLEVLFAGKAKEKGVNLKIISSKMLRFWLMSP